MSQTGLHKYYFDHNPDHAYLWQCLDADFQQIPADWDDPEDFEAQVDHFFEQTLNELTGTVLLVYHVSELRDSHKQRYQLRPEVIKKWKHPEYIFTLFVTGGEALLAHKEIQAQQLPRSHFQAYSLAQVDDLWSEAQRLAWKKFMHTLTLTGLAQWSLLEIQVDAPQ